MSERLGTCFHCDKENVPVVLTKVGKKTTTFMGQIVRVPVKEDLCDYCRDPKRAIKVRRNLKRRGK